MNIEVGKFYQLRNGCKVRIYAIDGGDSGKIIHGAWLAEDKWLVSTWLPNGEYGTCNGSNFDIVAEWKEPPKKIKKTVYVRLWKDGQIGVGIYAPTENWYNTTNPTDQIVACRKIEIEFIEGERPE